MVVDPCAKPSMAVKILHVQVAYVSLTEEVANVLWRAAPRLPKAARACAIVTVGANDVIKRAANMLPVEVAIVSRILLVLPDLCVVQGLVLCDMI
jgi:hypothetical protein